MLMRTMIPLGLIGLLIMTSMFARSQEELVPEDGKISAKQLPFDAELSKRAYETATFGMG